MPAYHSAFNKKGEYKTVGNLSVLPIHGSKGPAPALADPEQMDIVDEALYYFRANVLFRTFEVQGDADRVLVYVTLFASQCLQEVATARCEVKADVQKVLRQLGGASTFALPGVAGFPVSAIISCAPSEREPMRQYLKQLRAVTAERLYDRLINEDGSVNKWWLSFSKRKFMGKSL